MSKHWRSLFISDFHLGSMCEAEALLLFLKENTCETLYLVGDIIDLWSLRHWRESHNTVIQKILKLARHGVKVIYIPGNHDEALREYCGMEFGNIHIYDEVVHIAADGKKYLVLHGDIFDIVTKYHEWVAQLGGIAYEGLVWLNKEINHWFKPKWSLSSYIKRSVKDVVKFISDYEENVIAAAKNRGVDGVICGHIHRAEMRYMGNFVYCNCGDWIEEKSAIVEDFVGKLFLLSTKS